MILCQFLLQLFNRRTFSWLRRSKVKKYREKRVVTKSMKPKKIMVFLPFSYKHKFDLIFTEPGVKSNA